MTVPGHVRANGVTRLMKPRCKTNAGKAVTVRVSGGLINRGDVRLFRVYRNRHGATVIGTHGRTLRLRVHWSAPKTPGFKSYSQTKRYRT